MANHTQTATRDIPAEPDRVWKVLTDVESASQVRSSVRDVEKTSEGPFRIGSRWRQTGRVDGQDVTQEVEVTEVEALGKAVLVARGEGGERTTTYRLEALHPGTRLTATVEGGVASSSAEGAGGVLRKAFNAVTSTLSRNEPDAELEQDLADIAAAAENRTSDRG